MIILLYLYFIIVLTMMLRRFLIYFIFKNKSYGEDRALTEWAKYRGKAYYYCAKYKLKEEYHTNDYWNKIKIKLSNIIQKNNLNLAYDYNKKKYYIKKKIDINNFCIEKKIDYLDFYKLNEIKKNNSFVLNKSDNSYNILIDHIVYDGVNGYNKIQSEFFNLDKIELKKNIYIPFINENLIIFKLIKIFYNLIKKKKTLISSNLNQESISHNFDINIVKKYKNEFNLKFIDISIALYCKKVFDSLIEKKERLNVGLIYSLDDKRFKNNYFFIDLYIYNDELINIANDIHKQIEYKKKFVYIQHNIMSCYNNINQYYKSNFDIYFSPMFINSDEIIDFKMSMFEIYQPLYCFMGSSNNFVTFSTTINCNNINKIKFSEVF